MVTVLVMVNNGLRLMQVATQTAATDPRTGTIDMDMISTGRTQLDRYATNMPSSCHHHAIYPN